MNKFLKGVIATGLCLLMVPMAACGGDDPTPTPGPTEKTHDSEKRILQLATGALDENFNPFFYTSQNDGDMVSMTQIAMLTIDKSGKIAYGDDWPTVVQDYVYTMYDTKTVGTGHVTATGSENGRTEYEFLIKNGIKFSDGESLTIKDVLFNLYVYLDYAYTGSSTIYSTDIQGLKKYQSQDSEFNEDSTFGKQFMEEAQTRVSALIDWSNGDTNDCNADDLKTVKTLFEKEIDSDWNNMSTSWKEGYKQTHRFTETWEAYLYQEGIVEVQTRLVNGKTVQVFEDKNGDGVRQDGELYYTTLDPYQYGENAGEVRDAHLKAEVEGAITNEKVQEYITSHEGATAEYAKEQLMKAACLKIVSRNYLDDRGMISNVLTYWATASETLQKFASEASTKYFNERPNEKKVKSIEGITTRKVTSFNGKQLDGEHDVLKIVINGIDPKAIYNFAYTVAPLHYYSGTYTNKKGITTNYVTEFNGVDNFGVAVGDGDFFTDVLGAVEKNKWPVGAGAYKATDNRGGDDINIGGFCENNIVHFKRNENFNTVAKNIQNAKIKYINYKVYNDDLIMDALKKGEVDYAKPNAEPSTVTEISNNSFLTSTHYRAGGYGYVGINPKFIPEYKVRQAIMKSMNTLTAVGFYGSSLAEEIYRPMSTTSWAYPKGATEYADIAFETDEQKILKLVTDSGYELQNGVLTKVREVDGMTNAAIGTKLKFTLTIAGDTATGHPAYRMFLDAAETLNSIGFNVNVSTDQQALKKLSSGGLTVWAAAWSSSVDPDMYQVYHMYSNATNVRNWNYPEILNDTQKWRYEYNIIKALSDNIELGRKYTEDEERIPIYADCLDQIMSLAVELPTYQRDDLCVYNNTVIDSSTLVEDANHNVGLFDLIWEIDYV